MRLNTENKIERIGFMNKKNVGENIEKLRKKQGLSQSELAEKLVVQSKENVSNWESGKTLPKLEVLSDLSNLFGVHLTDLLYGKKDDSDARFEKEYFLFEKDCDDRLITNFGTDDRTAYFYQAIRTEADFYKYALQLNEGTIKRADRKILFYLTQAYFGKDKSLKDGFSYFRAIRGIDKNLSDDEKKWELSKLFTLYPTYCFKMWYVQDLKWRSYGFFEQALDLMTPWEKDRLLAFLSHGLTLSSTPFPNENMSDNFEFWGIEASWNGYEEEYRDYISLLLSKGAMVNDEFCAYRESYNEYPREIDYMDEIRRRVIDPLKVKVVTPEGTTFYSLENTLENLIVVKFWNDLVKPLLDLEFSREDILSFIFDNNGQNEIMRKYCEKKGIAIPKGGEGFPMSCYMEDLSALLDALKKAHTESENWCWDVRFWNEGVRTFEEKGALDGKAWCSGTKWTLLLDTEEKINEYVDSKIKVLTYAEFLKGRNAALTNRLKEMIVSKAPIKDIYYECLAPERRSF